jgi:hypothetical protein
MPTLSLINTIYLCSIIGAFSLFAAALFVVSLVTGAKR